MNKKYTGSKKNNNIDDIDDLEHIRMVKAEVAKWPKWKRLNIKLAFSENYQKKPGEKGSIYG